MTWGHHRVSRIRHLSGVKGDSVECVTVEDLDQFHVQTRLEAE